MLECPLSFNFFVIANGTMTDIQKSAHENILMTRISTDSVES